MKNIEYFAIIFIVVMALIVPLGILAYQYSIGNENIIITRIQEDGGFSNKEINIEKNVPTTLTFISYDVVHSFSIEELNISLFLYPGKTSEITLTIDEGGIYDFRCTYFCSPLHAIMRGKLIVT